MWAMTSALLANNDLEKLNILDLVLFEDAQIYVVFVEVLDCVEIAVLPYDGGCVDGVAAWESG